MAHGTGLDVQEFTATDPTRIVLDDIAYESTTITMVVINELSDILAFLSLIEAELAFNTTSIDSVTIEDLEGSIGNLDNLKLIEITLLAYIGD
jgi:hypothetical protein